MHTKFLIPVLFVSAIFVSCQEGNQPNNKNLKYPKTTKTPVIDTLFGTAVTDNYRWLEDDRSAETSFQVQLVLIIEFYPTSFPLHYLNI